VEFTELKDRIKSHKWRLRFSFFPTKRIMLIGGCVVHDGYYFWRIVIEVEVGLGSEWTAYSHFNDDVKFSGNI